MTVQKCSNKITNYNKHGPKIWGGSAPFLGRRAGSPSNTKSPGLRAEAYLHAKYHLDPSSRFTTINMGRKFGGDPPPFWGGERGPHLTQSPGPRPTSTPSGILIHAAIWPQQIWAENWWGCAPLGDGGAGSPSNTVWPGPRPICVPSFILIRLTVWPQYTNVTDRTGQDNGPIAEGKPFYKRSPKNHI